MDMKELENIMISHGVVLRAIPEKVIIIYEKRHVEEYPNGTLKYLEDFKREILVVERIPKEAGKFVITCEKNTSSTVKFTKKKFFDSIEQAVEDLLRKE